MSIKNKNILIVSNGKEPNDNNKYGDLIDNTDFFDKVVRLSWYEINDEHAKVIGRRTDINSTIWWKYRQNFVNTDLILSNHLSANDKALNSFLSNKFFSKTNKVIHKHAARDDDEMREWVYKYLKPTDSMKTVLKKCNFSLGFRTIFLVLKLFPEHKIYTHGFTFFTKFRSDCAGYYWDPQHNRHRANRHPYIYEKMCYEQLIKNKVVYRLNSVSNVQ